MPLRDVFRLALLERMHELGMSQRALAARLGWSQKHVSRVLTGRAGTDLDGWARMAAVLGATWRIELEGSPMCMTNDEEQER